MVEQYWIDHARSLPEVALQFKAKFHLPRRLVNNNPRTRLWEMCEAKNLSSHFEL